jgi:hypothetical protein
MSDETQAILAPTSLVAKPVPVIHRISPETIVAFGLILSVGWTGLLGYGFFQLAKLFSSLLS